jgi:hypothetical protein
MRDVSAFVIAAIAAAALGAAAPAAAQVPAIAPEMGTAIPARPLGPIPYRCAAGPVYNFYHGAWYGGEPPAVYRGQSYRPFYRYSAHRTLPKTVFCVEDPYPWWPHW